MFRKFVLGLALAFLVGNIFPQLAVAKDPAKESGKGKAEITDEIERTLDEPTTMDFQETPLSDVIDFLRDLHRAKHPSFEIALDMKVLSELGITSDTPMTKNLKGISLRSALRILLRDLGLAYVIRDEVLLITSPENACYTKVYDVADLVAAKDSQNQAALDSLMNMVVKTCPAAGGPVSTGWVASLNSADIAAIVVYQPEEIQDQVLELLTKLRNVRHTK